MERFPIKVWTVLLLHQYAFGSSKRTLTVYNWQEGLFTFCAKKKTPGRPTLPYFLLLMETELPVSTGRLGGGASHRHFCRKLLSTKAHPMLVTGTRIKLLAKSWSVMLHKARGKNSSTRSLRPAPHAFPFSPI
ncbi:hypothetical protein HD806DRAFT_226520 [Xylariaceae sp. AK1471]|nr:hypothetical protein HD806DRAFT_226520 [Xylariaceae sp. AK1471]